MTDNKNENNIIVKTNSTGIIKVGNSLRLTQKIIKEYDNRVIQLSFPTVKICNQEWMTKNLDVVCYSNGDPIPQVQNPKEWENLKTGAWCYYENELENGLIYGKLYNGFAVHDERGIAPKGFKIPSIEDFEALFKNLSKKIIRSKVEFVGWKYNGNNDSKLNLNLAGFRFNNSVFYGLSQHLNLWTFKEENKNSCIDVTFDYYPDFVYGAVNKTYGLPIRCIKI